MGRALVVVDMQHDFIDGSLGSKEAQAIVGRVAERIADYRASGDPVLFTMDTHSEDYLNTKEGQKLPVVHCVKGTKGWEIADGLLFDGADVIEKPTFGSEELVKKLKVLSAARPLDTIELCGLCTDICVVSNALLVKAAFYEDADVLVDASCCAGVTPETHADALSTMKMCQITVAESREKD